MPRQFWNEEKTTRSLAALKKLAGETDFVLIGGWAVYMYVKAQMSEDIDIALDYDRLNFFRKYGISDYGTIAVKYSNVEGTVVDLFLPQYSDRDIPIPVSDILESYALIGGVKVVERNMLLVLKLWGYFRADVVKMRKDVLDVVSLLFYGGIDTGRLRRCIEKYKIPRRRSYDVLLEYLDKGETLWEYIADSKQEYQRRKEKWKTAIRSM